MNKIRNVLWGVVLIILGLLIGAKVLGFVDINIFFDGWWTLFIIVPCFIGLFDKGGKTGNIIGIILGVALLLACRDVVSFDMIWKLALPTVLVIVGLSIIFKDSAKRKINKEFDKFSERFNTNEIKNNEHCAAFSGQKLKFDYECAKDCSLTAIFGGIEYDLRLATIDKDIFINATSIFGGIDIFVPDNVKVKVKSTSIFGGVEDKKRSVADENAHTIYVNAVCIFGGVDIK